MNFNDFEQFEMDNAQTENTVGGKRRRRGNGRKVNSLTVGGGGCQIPPVSEPEVEVEVEQPVLLIDTSLEAQEIDTAAEFITIEEIIG